MEKKLDFVILTLKYKESEAAAENNIEQSIIAK